ncbi:MAG: Asp23/Gls24 family envelope stress response protein [Arthrobacter sp.]|uniref:Asp23/Gls24 family envelope stress response protein n=1 Tax=Arthrobacter sp. TaxID=1667 RepID=UPI0034773838
MDHQNPTPATLPPEPAAPPAVGPAGSTAIGEAAVAKVAAAAARSVEGVHSLGMGGPRSFGALRGAVGSGPEPSPGVTAEVGATEAAVDVVLTATFGRPLHHIADDVRSAVYRAVESLTGLRVIEVNVEIGDVHLPEAHAPGPHTPELRASAPESSAPAAPGAGDPPTASHLEPR